ncbi:hypothetical protein FF38_07901 [Lucilia cuprina]|uniref:Uncharacterized protein n=1 Tax=Lucilia cuprina TaxID=7375 RepID=A0A0L0BKX1_LUCCU|nr:hypothetical protein FF38_07901 [Lucilia cuprina]
MSICLRDYHPVGLYVCISTLSFQVTTYFKMCLSSEELNRHAVDYEKTIPANFNKIFEVSPNDD